MKTIIFLHRIWLTSLFTIALLVNHTCAFAQNKNDSVHSINCAILQNEILTELKNTFPFMTIDSTLFPILYAPSQSAAGSPACYGTHFGKYINPDGNEKKIALQIVAEYKEFLINRIFLKESAIKTCNSKSFCATATKENALIHVELIIDNGLRHEDLIFNKDY